MWFTTNRMCVKNKTIIYEAWASNSKRDCEHDLYCCLMPRCEALRTCRSGFPIATIAMEIYDGSFAPFVKLQNVFSWKILQKLKNFFKSKSTNECFKKYKIKKYFSPNFFWNKSLLIDFFSKKYLRIYFCYWSQFC